MLSPVACRKASGCGPATHPGFSRGDAVSVAGSGKCMRAGPGKWSPMCVQAGVCVWRAMWAWRGVAAHNAKAVSPQQRVCVRRRTRALICHNLQYIDHSLHPRWSHAPTRSLHTWLSPAGPINRANPTCRCEGRKTRLLGIPAAAHGKLVLKKPPDAPWPGALPPGVCWATVIAIWRARTYI